MNSAYYKGVIEDFDALLNTQQLDRLDTLCAPDMVNHSLAPSRPQGLEGTREFLRSAGRQFASDRWKSVTVLADGEFVVQFGERGGLWPGGRFFGVELDAGPYARSCGDVPHCRRTDRRAVGCPRRLRHDAPTRRDHLRVAVMTRLPMGVRASNTVIRGLHRLGVPVGPTRLLTSTGRTTGLPRTTPVSPVTVDGSQYLLAAYATGQWVANARASGRAVLARGRHRVRVDLVEVPPSERGPIVTAYPTQVPHGASMFVKAGTVESPTPDGFAADATNIVVFKIDPANEES